MGTGGHGQYSMPGQYRQEGALHCEDGLEGGLCKLHPVLDLQSTHHFGINEVYHDLWHTALPLKGGIRDGRCPVC